MKYLIFIGLALVEQIIMLLITKEIIQLQYEYITIQYATFKFSDKEEKFCGLNILLKMFFPLIYLILIVGIFYSIQLNSLVEDIYMVNIFYYIIRWLNVIFILGRKDLHDWKTEIIITTIGVVLNFIIYNIFIIKTQQIFISIETLRDGIWVGIITFFFVLMRDLIYKYAHTNREKSEKRKKKYILRKYEKYRNKYDQIIDTDNKEIEDIVYGIMIYESYNRPTFYRMLEYIKCTITGQATLGIMQVKSRVFISNKTSVKLGYRIVKEAYNNCVIEEEYKEERIRDILMKYNGGISYADEVMYIIMILKEETENNIQLQEYNIEEYEIEYENEGKWIRYLLYDDTSNDINSKEFEIEYFEYNENTLVDQFWDKLLEKYSNSEKIMLTFKIVTVKDCYYIDWESANCKFKDFISKIDDENIIIILPCLPQGVTVARYDFYKIIIHSNEGVHKNMPHIHIINNDGRTTRVSLNDLKVLDEEILPKKVYKEIFDYLDENKEYLINLYNDIVNHKQIKKVTIDVIDSKEEDI